MIVFIGNFINSEIKIQRRLPAYNPAGSNRMLRLAQSLNSIGEKTLIVSPGSALRMKWAGKLIHKSQLKHQSTVSTFFCCAVGLPIIGVMFEQIVLPFSLWIISRKHNVSAIITYCYYPSSVWATLLAKYILKIKVIEDLEDICDPKLSDWKRNFEGNPVQQIIGWAMMKIMICLSSSVIVPSIRFKNYISNKKNVEVIDGCMHIPQINYNKNKLKQTINILFAGALEDENGIPLFLNFLHLVSENEQLAKRIIIHISGHGSKGIKLKEAIDKYNNIKINFYNFLSDKAYQDLLSLVDVCLVLQDPHGRYSQYKTPSKGYEYMSYGKAVITSSIGDFSSLPDNIRLLLVPYNALTLFEIISNLKAPEISKFGESASLYALNHWSLAHVGAKLNRILI